MQSAYTRWGDGCVSQSRSPTVKGATGEGWACGRREWRRRRRRLGMGRCMVVGLVVGCGVVVVRWRWWRGGLGGFDDWRLVGDGGVEDGR